MPEDQPISVFSSAFFPFWMVMSLILGMLWGSFFNVCIYRLPMGLSPNRPRRSFCFSCGMEIAWYDNIPLLSWLILRGKCRHCGGKISFRYFAIELLCGLMFAGLWWAVNGPQDLDSRGLSISILWYWAVAGMLLIGAMTDIDHWIIPDGITRGGFAAAILAAAILPWIDPNTIIAQSGPFPAVRMANWSDPVEAMGAVLGRQPRGKSAASWRAQSWREGRIPSRTFVPPNAAAKRGDLKAQPSAPSDQPIRLQWWEGPANALLGALVGYGLLWMVAFLGKVAFRREAMGGGDLKLFGFLGAALGPFNVLLLLFLSSIVGMIIGLSAIAWSAMRPPRRLRLSDFIGDPEEAPPAAAQDMPAAAQDGGGENLETSSPIPPESQQNKSENIIQEYLVYARKRPPERAFHHIPFGPSISLAAILLLAFQSPFRKWLLAYMLPGFDE